MYFVAIYVGYNEVYYDKTVDVGNQEMLTDEEIDELTYGFAEVLEEYQKEQKREALANELNKALGDYNSN